MGERIRNDQQLTGVGIPERRASLDTLTPVGTGGAGSSDSAYTEVGPGPGQAVSSDPESKLTVEVSNGQETPIEVQVRTAGMPGREELGVLWREQTGSADDWRSRNEPQLLDRWAAVKWSDTLDYPKFELLTDPLTQQLLCLSARDVTDTIEVSLFDWQTGTWVASNDASVDPTTSTLGVFSDWGAVTGVALPNGRLLALGVDVLGQLRVFATDNLVDWSSYSDVAGTTDASTSGATMTEYRRDLLLLTTVAAGDVRQFVSNSLGTTFDQVGSTFLAFGFDLHVRGMPDNGGIVVAYRRFADSRPAIRLLSSAAEPLTDAAEVLVDAASSQIVTELALEVDENGTIYVLGRPSVGGGSRTADEVVVWTSTDGGATFSIQAMPVHASGDVLTAPVNLTCRFCRGWLVTAHQWVANPGNEGNSIGTMWSGGWDNRALLDFWPETWVPLDLPAGIGGWANQGATLPTLAPPGVMEFSLAASTGYVELDPADASASVFFAHRIDSGTPSLGLLTNGVSLRRANGATNYRLQVRISDTATRLYDTGAAAPIGSDLALDGTVWRQWTLYIDSLGRAFVFYRDQWSTRWVAALYEHQLTSAGVGPTTNRIRAGSVSSTTVVSHWRRLDDGKGAFPAIGLRPPTATGDKSLPLGAPLSSLPNALPEVGGADPAAADLISGAEVAPLAAYLAAVRGPGRRDEVFSVDPFFELGVPNLFPELEPSPSKPWQAQDTSEVRFVWDLGADTQPAHGWHRYLALLGCNFRQAVLEASNNGSAWTAIGTWDGADGFSGLTYTLVGDTLRPAPGTAAGARFLARNVLAPGGNIANRAGTAILDTGGTPVAVPILGNSAGSWRDPTTPNTQYAEVRVGGDLSGIPSTGTCDLVFPDGVLLARVPGVFPAASQFYRWWRLRIPAGQDIVDDGYRIGARSLGSVAVFGKRPSRGWSQGMAPNTSQRRSRFGVRRRRQEGPSPRRWSLNWADGMVLTKINQTDEPDYLAAGASSAALATVDDVWWTLWALQEETDGWAVPVLALNSIPNTASAMLTDRTRFLFGHVDLGSIQATGFLGNIADDEKVRVDAIAVDESL